MTGTAVPAMQKLRESTRDEHDRAEHHAFQQGLVKGELSRERYVAWLGQMYLIHSALEDAVRGAAGSSEAVRTVVHDYQYQVPYLLEDLEFFGADPDAIEPQPATARFASVVDRAKDDPTFLLGMHYVLEGSNNGSRFIARHVGSAYDLAPGPGLRYLNPYGDRQRDYWATFKEEMGSLDLPDSDTARLIEAAKQMYATIAELSDDLAAQR